MGGEEAEMKKGECETFIRELCRKWGKRHGVSASPASQPSFQEFISWVRQNYPAYLKFKTSTSVEYDAEMWFDQEFKQTWRR